MQVYLGWFLLGLGVVLFTYTWFNQSRKNLPLMFVATMMVMAGLVILQLFASGAPHGL